MKCISLLHIGDIHYDDMDLEKGGHLDLQSKRFPVNIISPIIPRKNHEIIRKVMIEELAKSPSAILFIGDLTTQGNFEGYKECLVELKKIINPKYFEDKKLFIVPGNHDVSWELAGDDKLIAKFNPVIDLLKENGFPQIPLNDILPTMFNDPNLGKINIICLNSCKGCGEKVYYPEEIREGLLKLIKSKDLKYYETLETPIFTEGDIEKLISTIQSSKEALPVIVAHHNLLPQQKPRVTILTETINQGYLRNKLLSLNRPILYLHGHIHDNIVEIVSSPQHSDALIINISAPLLFPNKGDPDNDKCGFNKIKIFFANDQTAIGCEVTNFLIKDNELQTQSTKIPFWKPPKSIGLADDTDRKILSMIGKQEKNSWFLGQLIDAVTKDYKGINADQVEQSIEKLNWLGLVKYENGSPQRMRHVAKVIY